MDADLSEYSALITRLRSMDRKLAAQVRGRLRAIGGRLGDEILREGAELMPKRGGLRAHLRGGRVGVSLRKDAVVIGLQARAGIQLQKVNEGRLRHPVFGGDQWVMQLVREGTYSRAFMERREEVAAELMEEINKILKEIGGHG